MQRRVLGEKRVEGSGLLLPFLWFTCNGLWVVVLAALSPSYKHFPDFLMRKYRLPTS